MTTERRVHREADLLVDDLARAGRKLVLAESCTGGQVAAALATVPGVSRNFCGSFVVYRDASKVEWLGLASKKLINRFGDVSAETTSELALQALARTTEASISGAVTGYLGPEGGAVGRVYYAIALRENPEGLLRSGGGRVAPVVKERNKTRRAVVTVPDLKCHLILRKITVKYGRSRIRESVAVLVATHCIKSRESDTKRARRDRQLVASMTLIRMVRSLLNESHSRRI